MAGLSLLLQRHLKKPALSHLGVREAIAAFEAVGPWFLTLFALSVMGMTVHLATHKPPILFYLILTYASAISLIISAPLHTLLNRFLADELFLANYQAIIDNLVGLTVMMVAVCAAVTLPLALISDMAWHLKLTFIGLTVLMSLLWCVSAVMSALRKERLLLATYAVGMGLAIVLFMLARIHDTQAMLLAFSLGVAVPAAHGFAFIIKVYLRQAIRIRWQFLARRNAGHLFCSIAIFNLGFWCDKFIFWFHPATSRRLDPLFHYSTDYDFPFFVALTTMMLGSVMVYRGIRRKVSDPYERFLFKLTHNFAFRELALEKFKLFNGIAEVSNAIIALYGGMVVLVLFLVYVGVFSLPWPNPFVFHYLLLGTVFFSLYFFYFLIIQYLDDYGALLWLNLIFALVNAGGTLLSIHLGLPYYGTGFMVAAMVSALVAYIMVNLRVGSLEYRVFRDALEQAEKTKK